jgi:hypothetical protein
MRGLMRAPAPGGGFPLPREIRLQRGRRGRGRAEALLGRRVFCLHPHQDRFLAPAAMCIPVPDAVPDRRAVLAANMETAVNVLWDARPLVGERALVIGAGVVGLLVAFLLARIPGLDLACLRPSTRAARTRRGARRPLRGAPRTRRRARPDRPCLASPGAAPRPRTRAAASRARIVEASWFGDREARCRWARPSTRSACRIVSTQVGAVAPAMRGRRTHGERMALALSLLGRCAARCAARPGDAFEDLPAPCPRCWTRRRARLAPLCPVVTYI